MLNPVRKTNYRGAVPNLNTPFYTSHRKAYYFTGRNQSKKVTGLVTGFKVAEPRISLVIMESEHKLSDDQYSKLYEQLKGQNDPISLLNAFKRDYFFDNPKLVDKLYEDARSDLHELGKQLSKNETESKKEAYEHLKSLVGLLFKEAASFGRVYMLVRSSILRRIDHYPDLSFDRKLETNALAWKCEELAKKLEQLTPETKTRDRSQLANRAKIKVLKKWRDEQISMVKKYSDVYLETAEGSGPNDHLEVYERQAQLAKFTAYIYLDFAEDMQKLHALRINAHPTFEQRCDAYVQRIFEAYRKDYTERSAKSLEPQRFNALQLERFKKICYDPSFTHTNVYERGGDYISPATGAKYGPKGPKKWNNHFADWVDAIAVNATHILANEAPIEILESFDISFEPGDAMGAYRFYKWLQDGPNENPLFGSKALAHIKTTTLGQKLLTDAPKEFINEQVDEGNSEFFTWYKDQIEFGAMTFDEVIDKMDEFAKGWAKEALKDRKDINYFLPYEHGETEKEARAADRLKYLFTSVMSRFAKGYWQQKQVETRGNLKGVKTQNISTDTQMINIEDSKDIEELKPLPFTTAFLHGKWNLLEYYYRYGMEALEKLPAKESLDLFNLETASFYNVRSNLKKVFANDHLPDFIEGSWIKKEILEQIKSRIEKLEVSTELIDIHLDMISK